MMVISKSYKSQSSVICAIVVSASYRRAGWEVLTIGGVKIGKNLRRVREERLMTQQELADAAGLGLSTVLRIENDRVEPRFSTIRKLAKALDVDARELTRKED
jgi:DNA-binding XRE family transcriptional regulator